MLSAPASPVIVIRGASVHYDGAPALSGIDLTVNANERVALLGRSGAGKSSLLRLLNGSVQVSSGSVQVLGTDMVSAGPRELRELRRRIGTIAQGLDLPGPLRVRHNVTAGALGAIRTRTALRSLLSHRVGSATAAALVQVELDGFADRRTDELSGGEQQRVAVARVLLQKPQVVLADEPASSLDPDLANVIVAALTSARWSGPDSQGPTVIASLHNLELARRHCDRIVGLVDGRIAVDVAVSELDSRHLGLIYPATAA